MSEYVRDSSNRRKIERERVRRLKKDVKKV